MHVYANYREHARNFYYSRARINVDYNIIITVYLSEGIWFFIIGRIRIFIVHVLTSAYRNRYLRQKSIFNTSVMFWFLSTNFILNLVKKYFSNFSSEHVVKTGAQTWSDILVVSPNDDEKKFYLCLYYNFCITCEMWFGMQSQR